MHALCECIQLSFSVFTSSCDACIKDIDCGFCNENGETSGSCLPAANEERSLYGRCNTSESDDSKFRFAHGYCPSDKYSWMTAVGVALFVFLFSPGKCDIRSIWMQNKWLKKSLFFHSVTGFVNTGATHFVRCLVTKTRL